MSSDCTFDFDRWSKLASEDPEAFEALRRTEIDKLISAAPGTMRLKLEQLQFRIDGVRRRNSTALGCCVAISALMWEKLAGQGGLLEALDTLRFGVPTTERTASVGGRSLARVLEFPNSVTGVKVSLD